MHVKVPEVKRCCCCLPLRYGIVVFGLINVLLSLLAVACLVVATEVKRSTLTDGSSLEVITATVLYSILGMGVILNILLLVGGCQKDISMLRLYNHYAVLTIVAALVPLIVLLSRKQYADVCAGLTAVVTQMYVSILVRSEVVKLERKLLDPQQVSANSEVIDTPDTDTLL
ncbi:uncharacterized protein LOC135088349 [Ostrinia nubilalis]|uniref:uncharacterized protein LOC135088349 n=1 Tax=Ostrinia nubilalis TaxID=29057 RepID=UPI00308258A2